MSGRHRRNQECSCVPSGITDGSTAATPQPTGARLRLCRRVHSRWRSRSATAARRPKVDRARSTSTRWRRRPAQRLAVRCAAAARPARRGRDLLLRQAARVASDATYEVRCARLERRRDCGRLLRGGGEHRDARRQLPGVDAVRRPRYHLAQDIACFVMPFKLSMLAIASSTAGASRISIGSPRRARRAGGDGRGLRLLLAFCATVSACRNVERSARSASCAWRGEARARRRVADRAVEAQHAARDFAAIAASCARSDEVVGEWPAPLTADCSEHGNGDDEHKRPGRREPLEAARARARTVPQSHGRRLLSGENSLSAPPPQSGADQAQRQPEMLSFRPALRRLCVAFVKNPASLRNRGVPAFRCARPQPRRRVVISREDRRPTYSRGSALR